MNLPKAERPLLGLESTATSTPPERWGSLSALPDSGVGRVRQLRGGREFAGRMAALGFTLGVKVTVLRRAESGPVIV